EMETLF
ncbi:Pyrroline-5-carboxylate reductase, partial [Haemophilus influenzae]